MTNELKPQVIWFNGEVVPWHDAKIHIWSEVAIRGMNVFDSMRAYWNPLNSEYNILALDEHLERLGQSARLLKFPEYILFDKLKTGIFELLRVLNYKEHTFVRPTLYLESGGYSASARDVKVGAYIVAFPSPHSQAIYDGIRCCISTWRRSNELVLSPRIKAGAAYLTFRLPRIEATERGYDEAILLNDRDTVAEAAGATLFIVKNNIAETPPIHAGILESITRVKMIELLKEIGVSVIEKEITRTELYTASEVFLCGTLAEIQPVNEIDGYKIGQGVPGPVTNELRRRFLDICENRVTSSWLTSVSI